MTRTIPLTAVLALLTAFAVTQPAAAADATGRDGPQVARADTQGAWGGGENDEHDDADEDDEDADEEDEDDDD